MADVEQEKTAPAPVAGREELEWLEIRRVRALRRAAREKTAAGSLAGGGLAIGGIGVSVVHPDAQLLSFVVGLSAVMIGAAMWIAAAAREEVALREIEDRELVAKRLRGAAVTRRDENGDESN